MYKLFSEITTIFVALLFHEDEDPGSWQLTPRHALYG